MKSERATSLQNRITVYQSLRDHHEYERDHAGTDELLEARSKGRVRAFAELIANLLRNSDAYLKGMAPASPQEKDFHDHPARIGHLAYQYSEQPSVSDPKDPFGPVEELLLELLSEIAALTEIATANADVQKLLLDAGHAVNAAVQPGDLIAPESTPECVRAYQIGRATAAFNAAISAAAALSPAIILKPADAPKTPSV